MKRIIIAVLSAVVCLSLFTGCKRDTDSESPDSALQNISSREQNRERDSSSEPEIETDSQYEAVDSSENSGVYTDLGFLPEDLNTFFETENRMINRVFGDGAGYLYMGIENMSRDENAEEYRADNGLGYIITTMDYADFKAYIKNYYSENAIKKLEQGAILDYNGKLALCTSSVGGFSNLDKPYYTDVKVEKDSVTFTKITGEEYGADSEIVRTWGQSYKFIKTSSGWLLDDWGRV